MADPSNGRGALAAGGLAAILASTCCLGPLVLITLGFSGAWIGNLTALEPYRPIFIGVALVALFFAWRRIFRPARACAPDDACAVPQVRTAYKVIFWLVTALDRQRRRGELRALRAQGVARRDASANGYLALVGTAAVIGPFAALASWLLVREHLPVFTDDPGTFPVPTWPSPLPVAAAWAVAVIVLAGVALLAGARLRAATRQR